MRAAQLSMARGVVAAVVLGLVCLGLVDLGTASANAVSADRTAKSARGLVNPRTGLPVGMMPTSSQIRSAASSQQVPNLASGAHLTYYGGPVVSNAAVVSVLWGGTGTYLAQVTGSVSPNMDTFFRHVTNSSYLSWLGEYDTTGGGTKQSIGLGSFAGRTAITPSLAARGTTVQDATIQTEVLSQINNGHLPAPTVDATGRPNTVYALFFPVGTTVCNNGNCSGTQFCAYHGSFTATLKGSVRNVRYMVLPHPDANIVNGCGNATADTAVKVLQSYTSHELIETITDPDVSLASSAAPPLAWYDLANGEIADICEGVADADGTVTGTDAVSYVVQKEWSNALNKCIVDKALADTTAPALTATQPSRLFQLSTTVTATYHASDSGTGVASYDVQYRKAAWNGRFSEYTTLATGTRATTRSLTGRPGNEYCFRERARDGAGNTSAWSPDRCAVIPRDDRSLTTATAGWRRLNSPSAYHRTMTKTTRKGAMLVIRAAQAHRLALIVTACRSCGRVAIYLDGVLWHTVSTAAPARRNRVILLPGTFSLRTATIALKNISRNRPVLIDGLALART